MQLKKAIRLAAAYNLIISMVWTILFVLPLFIYCYRFVGVKNNCIFLAVSFIGLLLPNRFYDLIQLSNNTKWYKRTGVLFINHFAQYGTVINHLIRKNNAAYKVAVNSKSSLQKKYYQTYVFEKFHFFAFLFFLMISIFAALREQWWWTGCFIISNLLYNIYPNLLQQYIRLKLKAVVKE